MVSKHPILFNILIQEKDIKSESYLKVLNAYLQLNRQTASASLGLESAKNINSLLFNQRFS